MLVLNNLSKIYKIKYGQVNALNNINYVFPDTGLFIIAGKSGSGKSTLLHILGCLDKPTTGTVYYNDEDICKYTVKEQNTYRAETIGYIFQDLNLINDLDVYQNINLPLKVQNKEIDNEKIDTILKKLDIINLKSRLINELSGGQKQRVAVARALIKQPKIILADEPTGSLDSYNSVELYKILKDISKDILVIVVSHDIENATKFADKVISITDGKILEGYKKDFKISSVQKSNVTYSLPTKESIILGAKFLFKKKLGFITSIILAVISITLLTISTAILTFDRAKVTYGMMKKDNDTIVAVENGYSQKEFTGKDYEYLKNSMNGISGYYYPGSFNHISTTTEIGDAIEYNEATVDVLGIKLLSGNEPKENEALISLATYNNYKEYGYKNGNFETIINDYNDIIGKTFDSYTICGIYDSDRNFELDMPYEESLDFDRNSERKHSYKFNGLLNAILIKEGTVNTWVQPSRATVYLNKHSTSFSFITDYQTELIKCVEGNGIYISTLDLSFLCYNESYVDILNSLKESLMNESYSELEAEELAKTQMENTFKDFILNDGSARLEIESYETKSTKDYSASIQICGYYYPDNYMTDALLTENYKALIDSYIYPETNVIHFYQKLDNIPYQVFEALIKNDKSEESIRISNYIKESVDLTLNNVSLARKLFVIVGIVILSITIIITSKTVSNNISRHYKDIGVLRSLGSSNKDIFKIYATQSVISFLCSIIFIIPVSIISIQFINNLFLMEVEESLTIVYLNYLSVIAMLLGAIILPLLSSIVPIYRLSRKSIIDITKLD